MNIIFETTQAAQWLKEILPKIRDVYQGKVITMEHYDIGKWKTLDQLNAFEGYDCLGLTLFPRKEYDGISDLRSWADYQEYVTAEAKVLKELGQKYGINCQLAVPMGLDYWQGNYPEKPHPDADIVAQATSLGLDILKEYQITGVFISHWASEEDHFGEATDVEEMLQTRWRLKK